MSQWLEILAIIGAIITVLTVLWKAGHWKGTVDEKLGSVGMFMEEIRADIKRIFERLPAPKTVASGSPRQLTDFGRKIAEKVHAQEWATTVAPTLGPTVEGQQPFQVDQFSYAYAHEKMDAEWQKRVDACAYEFGIDRSGVLDVLYVTLRDELIHLQNPK